MNHHVNAILISLAAVVWYCYRPAQMDWPAMLYTAAALLCHYVEPIFQALHRLPPQSSAPFRSNRTPYLSLHQQDAR